MEKGQSKVRSFWEANLNTLVGFLTTLLAAPGMYKLVGMEYTYSQLGWVTLGFTVLSVVRGYLIRRFFNKKEQKKDKGLVEELEHYKKEYQNTLKLASGWESLYRKGRTSRVKLQSEYYELSDELAELQDEYDYTVKVAKDYINGTENLNKFLNLKVTKLQEELDICKHLHTAAISDLVEGADYLREDTIFPGLETDK